MSKLASALFAALFYSHSAFASFHLMQVEQAVGGVCGDATRQAIQLRMRFAGQNLLSGHEVASYDANGENRILLLSFPTGVANGTAGARVLLATSELAASNGLTPDFVLAQRIPAARLRAGKIAFEDSPGLALWSISYGGVRYLGSSTGLFTNDADGDFGPPTALELPFGSALSLRFPGAAGAASTTNAADYALSSGPASLTNNAGVTVTLPSCTFGDGFELGDLFSWRGLLGGELCNGVDDDGDLAIDEDFPLGQPCSLPGGATGAYTCAPDGRGALCTP